MTEVSKLSSPQTPLAPPQDSDAIINITSGIGTVVFAALGLLSAYMGHLYGAYAAAGAAVLSTIPLAINCLLSIRKEGKIERITIKTIRKEPNHIIYNDTELVAAIRSGNNKKAKQLVLNKNVDVNEEASRLSKRTALHWAAAENNIEMVHFLLENEKNKAKPDLLDDNFKTPLHLAVYCNCPEIIAILLNNRAATDIKDEANRTPFESALYHWGSFSKPYQLLKPHPNQMSAS